jgi:hypothetical protein
MLHLILVIAFLLLGIWLLWWLLNLLASKIPMPYPINIIVQVLIILVVLVLVVENVLPLLGLHIS